MGDAPRGARRARWWGELREPLRSVQGRRRAGFTPGVAGGSASHTVTVTNPTDAVRASGTVSGRSRGRTGQNLCLSRLRV